MGAAKRIELRPILKEAPSFRQDVLAYPRAPDAFAKIGSPKLNQDFVWRVLWDLACREEESRLQTKLWYAMDGLPLHTMRRFPNRYHDWAKEIKMVSARIQSAYGYSPALLPSIIESQVEGRGKPIPTPLARMLKARNDLPKLTELPDLLGLFADYIAAVHKLTTHFGPKALARYRTMTINTLVDYVEWATGKPHFPQIATLLTAAYYARGSKVVVHADNLRVQYNRHSGRKQ